MHTSLLPFIDSLRSGDPRNVVFFGDSIAFGSQVDPARDETVAFPTQWHDALKQHYPDCCLTLHNKGVPGNKIDDAHNRLQRDVFGLNPDLVIIEFGVNDCWDGPERIDHFDTRLRELVALIQQREIPLILLTANMLNHAWDEETAKLAWFVEKTAAVQNAGWTTAYMNRIRKIARELDLPLADGYARWERARANGTDTDTLLANRANHPNREGHRLLAEALLEIFA